MTENGSHERRLAPNRPLSSRELEVLEMTSQGMTNLQVARRLNLTVHAVKFHLASIYRKLGVANRTEATGVYLRAQAGAVAAHEGDL